ncbi:FecCD family ABC transporter permease [Metasolibacillus meyeri]|uniref:FecCD family ABC transporter permease n=1 Tax=Metasolibacillus meyeri TaxID=1071052 RepID=UPI000D3031DD|nr:iron ABC transporter permease [Metasolibacillus meyeri]
MNYRDVLTHNHQKKIRKNQYILLTLIVLIFLMFFISMNTGSIRLSPVEVIRAFFFIGTEKQQLILYEFRLPRIVISILVGCGLAVAGAVLQGITRNALADPGIIGINAGASLMAVLFVTLAPSNKMISAFVLPFAAFLGAGLAAILIYLLSYKKGEGITPIRLLLNGIAVAAGISAVTIVLVLMITPEQYQFVATWMAGSIWGSTWKYVFALVPWIVLLLPLLMRQANMLNILSLNELSAIGLGVEIEKERRYLLFLAVALAGASVSVSGGIGFVGLIAPHLARKLVGGNHKILLPVAALVGALLVLSADTIGRSLFAPSEIPAGIVVAVIGAPYFLYLLRK